MDALKKTAIKQYNENETGQRIFNGGAADEGVLARLLMANGDKFVPSEHSWYYENNDIPDFSDQSLNFYFTVLTGAGGGVLDRSGTKFMSTTGAEPGTACDPNDDYITQTPTDFGIEADGGLGYWWFGIMALGNFAYPGSTSCLTLVHLGSTSSGEFSMIPVIELK